MEILQKLKELATTRSAKIAYVLTIILLSIKSRKKLIKIYVAAKKEFNTIMAEARREAYREDY